MKIRKQLKEICKKENNYNKIKNFLQETYEQITDQPKEKGYSKKYDLCDIWKRGHLRKVFEYKLNKEESIIFEVIYYEHAPKGYFLVLNKFIKNIQKEFIMYICKENK